jgi:hypothetical protein
MTRIRTAALLGALVLAPLAPAAAQSSFVRGDCNVDQNIDISDPVFLLGVLFSGATPSSCADACDGNDDGNLDIADAVFGLSFLFSGGAAPAAPYPTCGLDPTSDATPCASYPGCAFVENCVNGVDDDGDGFIDCDDFDCDLDPACAVEICDDGVDNDNDGFLDCDDFDCNGNPSCPSLSHAIDIQPIWDTNCTFCHGGPNPFAGLNLEPLVAYSEIVGTASTECSVLDRIDPFTPSTSWLYRKIMGTHTAADITSLGCNVGTGNQMPPGTFCCITPAEEALIEQWILQGAAP